MAATVFLLAFFAGLLGVWNISYLDLNVRAVLPYSQALARCEQTPSFFCATFIYKRSFCQDTLGTNIGKAALKKRSDALCARRFPAHIQQLDMESNGKGVAIDGTPLPYLLRPMLALV